MKGCSFVWAFCFRVVIDGWVLKGFGICEKSSTIVSTNRSATFIAVEFLGFMPFGSPICSIFGVMNGKRCPFSMSCDMIMEASEEQL